MKKLLAILLAATMAVGMTACGNGGGDSSSESSSEPSSQSQSDTGDDAIAEAQKVLKIEGENTEIKSTGPNGETATPATSLSLTDDEIKKIREGGYKAGISFHYGGNDWSASQLQGLTDAFKALNIEIVATTDADFSAEQQVADIETIMAKKPDILVSIPTDATATADAYRRASEAGIKIVFMDNVPTGFTAGTDYVGTVSADNYGNGIIAADLIGEALNGEGKIGVIFYDVDFFVTNQRLEAFEKTMAEKYPNIEIVAKMGFQDENACDVVADAMLTQHPEVQAIFAHWDIPCEGVLSSLRAANRSDILLSTIDLGNNVAIEIAEGNVLGLGAQLPYDQGVAEAMLAAYALLGKETPAYVAVPAKRVDQSNVLEAYKDVYHVDPPQALVDAAK
ncbi:MAG: sugar ABC transporter substrate-binding protein [Clostridiales bacterium]|nr:MAG: sugar ABC transporter substrate-binding protein [Clostridiales bacterium]